MMSMKIISVVIYYSVMGFGEAYLVFVEVCV